MAFRSDLAREALTHTYGIGEHAGIRQTERELDGFLIDCVEVLTAQAAEKLGKPCGSYCTLTLDALMRRESDAFPRAVNALAALLTQLLPDTADRSPILVIGLGNRAITPDAVGPLTMEHILVTRHLHAQMPEQFSGWRSVCAAAVGVLGQTGVEAAEFTQSLCDTLHPAVIIAVDALAAGALSHLTRTIQVTDAGIVPGSGVGNARTAFNRQTFGVPVLAIGMPTVVDGSSILPETADAPPVFVTPREIDQRVRDAAKVIGYAINRALQPHLSVSDLDSLLS